MTTALEGGEWSAARLCRALPPGKTRYRFYRRLGGPQGLSGRAENLVPTGIRFQTVQPVVSRYTEWATRPTLTKLFRLINYQNNVLKRVGCQFVSVHCNGISWRFLLIWNMQHDQQYSIVHTVAVIADPPSFSNITRHRDVQPFKYPSFLTANLQQTPAVCDVIM